MCMAFLCTILEVCCTFSATFRLGQTGLHVLSVHAFATTQFCGKTLGRLSLAEKLECCEVVLLSQCSD